MPPSPSEPPLPVPPAPSDARPRSSRPRAKLPQVDVWGMSLARCDAEQLLDALFSALDGGSGGWLVTANLDFLRRHRKEPALRDLYAQADLRVADGMPLVWAARVQGTPLPERIAGASLLRPLAERAAACGRSLYLLGGDPGTAEASVAVLERDYPGLRIAGHESPWVAATPEPEVVAAIAERLRLCRPDFVLVALGSPKQERLIAALREVLPSAWFVGVGVSFSFLTGRVARAPKWMQRVGLEWAHRLSQEPGRLARRYLVEDAPFGLSLMAHSVATRLRRVAGRSTETGH